VAADWLFVIGLSLEISGALLVAGEIFLASREDVAARGAIYPSGPPHPKAQRGAAFTWVGGLLLILGFAIQLAGYVVAADDLWFVVVAPGAICAALLIGWLVALRIVVPLLHVARSQPGARSRTA
jgi:hypothetical protein